MAAFFATDDASLDTALADAAASAGVDTITLAAGVYSAPHTIDSAVVINGAKVGHAGDAGLRGFNESVLAGGIQVTAAGVTIDGVEVTGVNDFSGALAFPTGIYVTASGATIQNTLFAGTTGNSAGLTVGGAVTGLNVAHDAFTGYDRGMFVVQGATGTVQNNLFENASGSQGVVTESTGLVISNNTFDDAGGAGAAVFSTPLGSTDLSTQVDATNTITSILPAHAINIEVRGTGDFSVTGTVSDDAIYTADYPSHAGTLAMRGLAGSDAIWGGDGADTIDGGPGDDFLNGEAGVNTVSYLDAAAGVTVSLALQDGVLDANDLPTATQNTIGAGVDALVNFQNLTGSTHNDTLSGDGNANVITGAGGADTIHGGAGNDTATFSGTYASSTVTWNGTTATVTNATDGTDTIDGVGKLTFSGGTTVWLVGPTSEYTTVTQLFNGNAADGEVDADDVVFLAPGSYDMFDFGVGGSSVANDGIRVDSSGVTIRGAGDDASGANSTILNFNAQFSQETIMALQTGADVFTLRDVRIGDDPTLDPNAGERNYGLGINGDVDGVTVDNVTFAGTMLGISKGGDANIDHLTVTNSTFADNLYGIYLAVDGGPGTSTDHVLIDNDTFTNDLHAAIYGETLQNATLSNLTATNSGTGDSNGVVFDFWTQYAGASFSNIAFNNVTITNNAANPMFLAGIRVTAFEDVPAPGVSGNPAPTDISFTDVTISGNATAHDPIGLRTNADETELEFHSTISHPNGISLSNVDIPVRFEGRDGVDNFDASALPAFGNFYLIGDRFNQVGEPGYNGSGDTLKGGAGNDTVEGDGGDDDLTGRLGNDTINGGVGNDTIHYQVGDGADTVDGGDDSDTLAITGTAGNDTLTAVVTAGVLTGFAGGTVANVEHVTLALDGGTGDTLDYSGSAQAVTVNLSTPSATGFESISGVENVTGTSLADTLTGDGNANVLTGGGSGDTLTGGGASDTLNGGAGNDIINYAVGDGADATNGGADNDTLVITGTAGNDSIDVVLSGGVVSGLAGGTVTSVEFITLALGGGTGDTLDYTGTPEAVAVNLSTSSASGFSSIAGVENVTGASGNDTMVGDEFANVLQGNGGNDTFTGGGGDDTIIGGDGADTAIFTGARSEYLITTGIGVDNLGYATVEDLGLSGDGTDNLVDVKTLQFSDQTVSVPQPNKKPVVSIADHTVNTQEFGYLPDWISFSDADGDAATKYQFIDLGFSFGSAFIYTSHNHHHLPGFVATVAASDIPNDFIGGAFRPGQDTMAVRAFDGTAWSDWDVFTVTSVRPNAAASVALLGQFLAAHAGTGSQFGAAAIGASNVAADQSALLTLPQQS